MHYNFTSKEAMSAAIEEGRFLEFAQVHINLYGTRCEGGVLWCVGGMGGYGWGWITQPTETNQSTNRSTKHKRLT